MAASSAEVSCVERTIRRTAHERITGIGGVDVDGSRWFLKLNEAIQLMETNSVAFYFFYKGTFVDVLVATHKTHKYLKAAVDGVQPNALLSLRSCK